MCQSDFLVSVQTSWSHVRTFVPLFVSSAGPRPSQSHSRRGGDLPGVLRLGAAHHAHADRE